MWVCWVSFSRPCESKHWLSITVFPGQYEEMKWSQRQRAGEISKVAKKKKKRLNWNNPKIEIGWGWMERYPGTHKESQIKAIIL